MPEHPNILCVSTAGSGQDPLRMRRLTQDVRAECTYYDFDRSRSRWANMRAFTDTLRSSTWDLVYQEGTSIAGGAALIRAAWQWNERYVISSGDPVGGFFKTVKGPLWGMAFERYERLLYRNAAGFIGWTPYLTGMAMKMGAPRAVTVEGAVDRNLFEAYDSAKRRVLKQKYSLDPDHIVCGVVGSLTWTERQEYCYGLELVEMMNYLDRDDVSVLIVGDGDGKARLEARVPDVLRDRIVFTGRVPEEEVVGTLNAMDIGFITQTLDELGRYRLTTKLPEYLACGLPIAMSPIPGYYDYVGDAGWPLPAHHPADDAFHRGVATWLDGITREAIQTRRPKALARSERFSYERIRPRFTAFIHDLLSVGEQTPAGASIAT